MKSSSRFLLVCAASTFLGCSNGSDGMSGSPDLAPSSCASNADCAGRPATPECEVSSGECRERGFRIGTGDGSSGSVTLTKIYESRTPEQPTGIAFNPDAPNELWMVGRRGDYTTIISDAGLPSQQARRMRDPAAGHFMHFPTGIAFGDKPWGGKSTWGVCGDSDNPLDNSNGFMGPAVFPSDLSVFAKQTPGGLGSHLDMLHSTTFCMGITHERDNVYWVFDGGSGSLARYDFAEFHGPGEDDHSDGIIHEYAMGQVLKRDGVPSGLAFDRSTGLLYAADTGHQRIVKLDPSKATSDGSLPSFEPSIPEAMAADVVDVVPEGVLVLPSGLLLDGDNLYVSDNDTSRIHVFALDGTAVRSLDTGLPTGSLAGMTLGPDGKIWFVDMLGSGVYRIDP